MSKLNTISDEFHTNSTEKGARGRPAVGPSITQRDTEGGEMPGTTRGTNWSVTINNPTEDDYQRWENLKQYPFIKFTTGQLEKGEKNGVLHVQGYVRTDQIRLSQLKPCLPRAHIEIAKNKFALQNYVAKEETRVGEIKGTSVLTATPKKVQTYITRYVTDLLNHKGLPQVYFRELTGTKKNQTIVWKPEIKDWLTLDPNGLYQTDIDRQVQLLKLNREYLQHSAERIMDNVVEEMIEEGYYTVEFIMSNNQVRTAYKKYLTSIVIRNVKGDQEQEADATQTSPEEIEE